MQILSWSKNVLKKIQNIPIINSIKSLEKNAKMKTEKKKKKTKTSWKKEEHRGKTTIPHPPSAVQMGIGEEQCL